MSLLSLLRGHPPRVLHPPRPLDRLIWRRSRVVADDLDDLGETEGGPQPAEGRELVIVDLRHATIMPPPWPEHRVAALAGVTRDAICISSGHNPGSCMHPGSWPRPSCGGSSLLGLNASPVGWPVSAAPTKQPKRADYHARRTGKLLCLTDQPSGSAGP